MKKRQQGLTTVEAAIGAALMLILLFGSIEVARAIFVYNFLDEVTRRGARVAAVCPINHPAVRRVAIFAEPNGPSIDSSPYVEQLSTSYVNIDYLDAAGTTLTDTGSGFVETRFVRASIDSFPLDLLFFPDFLNTPQFKTILPSESLGYNPDYGDCRCWDKVGTGTSDGCNWVADPT